jgi:methylenetetrahydrofolate reductase (NADPH)
LSFNKINPGEYIMRKEKKFADQIKDKDFIITAEYLPGAETDTSRIKSIISCLKEIPSAVNVSDNPFGVSMSSFAASLHLIQEGIEPVFQMVTRDRNRIAMQSDMLGAASMGITNMLCLSGYHQILTDNPESANVYDIDSTQLLAMTDKLRNSGLLLNGTKIQGSFNMLTGAVANPFMKPVELNILRVSQKADAGAGFIQTHAVFDVEAFGAWLAAANQAGITDKTAVLAGILPLESAEEAETLREKYTDFTIPDSIIERLKSAGSAEARKKEGIAICAEIIGKIKNMNGLRGIHILSGGKEHLIPEILSASGLSGK